MKRVLELAGSVGSSAQLLRGEEAAELLGIGRSTVYEITAAGELPVTVPTAEDCRRFLEVIEGTGWMRCTRWLSA